MTTLRDPDRLSYVNKDVLAIDNDITRYINAFISVIKGMTTSNEGRLVLRILAGILDTLNYSVDMQFRESAIQYVLQMRNALRTTKLIGYKKNGAAGSLVDCAFTMRQGVAGAGGQAIPLWTQLQKSATPQEPFVVTEAAIIPEGESSVEDVPAVQGTPVTAEQLTASASGDPNQSYVISTPNVIESQIRVYVGGTLWTQVDNLWDSDPADLHYEVVFDEDNNCTVKFGDGTYGYIPPAASVITTDYIWTDGKGHDVGEGEVDTVLGALSGNVIVTNPVASAGGSDGDTVKDVKNKAPLAFASMWRAVTDGDVVEKAEDNSAVYSAKVKMPYGNSIVVYILPVGGGVASNALLTEVQDYIEQRTVLQGNITCLSVEQARVRIKANVVALNNRTSKSVLYKWARDTLLAAFEYDQFDVGEGYTISQLGEILLSFQDNNVFKSVDFEILSRWPRVTQSRDAAPAMSGDIEVFDAARYDTWMLTAVSASEYEVAKNGAIELYRGTVGVPYTPAGGEVRFTLGATTDTLLVGDYWTFKTSKLEGNVYVEENEHMSLDEADLEVVIYYPGEYDATT